MKYLTTKSIIILVILAIAGTVFYMNMEPTIQQENLSYNNDLIKQENNSTINSTTTENKNMSENKIEAKGAKIITNLGEIDIEFNTTAPNTIENFAKLSDLKFYDNVKFHRVIKGFMIQTGDPNSKDNSKISIWGTGGPGYKFNDELSGKETYLQGTVAMANSGPNTNGSQFFIVTAPDSRLPALYTVFGKVTKGMDIALKIENVKTDADDRPIDPVVIKSVTIIK